MENGRNAAHGARRAVLRKNGAVVATAARRTDGSPWVLYDADGRPYVRTGLCREVSEELGISMRTLFDRRKSGTAVHEELAPEDLVRPSEDPTLVRFQHVGGAVYALVPGTDPMRPADAYRIQTTDASPVVERRCVEGGSWEPIGRAGSLFRGMALVADDAASRGMLAPATA